MSVINFPSFSSKIKYSDVLISFFNDNNIKLSSSSFSLQILRDYYEKDIEFFYIIKSHLEVYGFNFNIDNGNIFLPNIDNQNHTYIYTDREGYLNPLEINKLGLWGFFSSFKSMKYSDLNYLPLERLKSVSKFSDNLDNLVYRIGYNLETTKKPEKIKIRNKEKVFTPVILDNNEEINYIRDINIKIPCFYIDIITTVPKLSDELISRIFNLGIKKISDLVTISNKPMEFCRSLDLNNDYSINLLYKLLLKIKKFNNSLFEDQNMFLNIKTTNVDINLNNVGLYNKEINFLKSRNINNLESLFDIDETTRIDIFRNDNFNINLFYYDINLIFKRALDYLNTNLTFYENEKINNHYLYKIKSFHSFENSILIDENERKIRLEIISARDKGITFEKLGNKYNLTRERIRQIEKIIINKIEKPIRNITNSIFKYNNYIPIYIVEKYIGMLSYFRRNKKYVIDEELGIIVQKSHYQYISRKVQEIISNLDKETIKLERLMNDNSLTLNYSLNNINLYKNNNTEWLPPKKTLREHGVIFLHSLGKEGFNLRDNFNDAKKYFHAVGVETVTERNVLAYITDNQSSYLIGLSKYAHVDYITSDQLKIMERIISQLEIPEEGIPFKTIYKENKEILNLKDIDSYIHLYGIASKFYTSQDVRFTGRSMILQKNHDFGTQTDNILNYLKENKNIASMSTLSRMFHLKETSVNNMKDLYRFDSETIVNNQYFTFDSSEKYKVKQIIDRLLLEKEFVHAEDIFNEIYFDKSINDFLSRNKIARRSDRLIYFLRYYYGEDYHFTIMISTISTKDNKYTSYSDIFKKLLKNNSFTRKDLKEIADKYFIRSSLTISDFIKNSTVQINKNEYILKEEHKQDKDLGEMIINHLNIKFKDNITILSKEIIRELKKVNIADYYWDKPEMLISLIEKNSDNKWIGVNNDMGQFNTNSNLIIVNNNKNKFDNVTFSELIIEVISSLNLGYLTSEDINNYLYDNEFINRFFSEELVYKIFKNHIVNGLIKV